MTDHPRYGFFYPDEPPWGDLRPPRGTNRPMRVPPDSVRTRRERLSRRAVWAALTITVDLALAAALILLLLLLSRLTTHGPTPSVPPPAQTTTTTAAGEANVAVIRFEHGGLV